MVYKYVVVAKMKLKKPCVFGILNRVPSPKQSDTLTIMISIYAHDITLVKLTQYKIEKLSLKTHHLEEVGVLFYKKMSEKYHLS
jgi:hypothetical protein